MDQVSRPVQVLFALTLLFGAVWFVALRPTSDGGGAPPPAPAPATPVNPPAKSAIPGPGKALDKARSGAAQANQDNAGRSSKVDRAAGAPGSPPGGPAGSAGGPAAPGAAAIPATIVITGAGRPVPAGANPESVKQALARGKAVVVLFYGRGSDDSRVGSELAQVGRRGGRVVVFRASIARVSSFGDLTTGVRVVQAPTVVVAGPSGKGRALPGFVDSTEIDQAISSVLARR